MVLSKDNLKNCFQAAIEESSKFIGVSFFIEGFPVEEVIINSTENFELKLKYYDDIYDEDLVHKYSNSMVQITGFTHGDTYDDIQSDLVD